MQERSTHQAHTEIVRAYYTKRDIWVGSRERRKGSSSADYYFGLVDRKSTRLNSSHANISYAVFCLKKKKEADYAFNDLLSRRGIIVPACLGADKKSRTRRFAFVPVGLLSRRLTSAGTRRTPGRRLP